jgi:hypothetical protein
LFYIENICSSKIIINLSNRFHSQVKSELLQCRLTCLWLFGLQPAGQWYGKLLCAVCGAGMLPCTSLS